MHVPFEGSPIVMFANVPLAKDNHMVKSRFMVGQDRNKLPLIREEQQSHTAYRPAFGEEYCDHFYK